MAPDIVKAFEIGRVILLAVRVVPEAHRHGREWPGAHQFTLFATYRPTHIIKHIDRHAEAAALDFAAIHRQHRITEHEAGHDIRTARNRSQQNVRLDLAIYPVKAFGDSGLPVENMARRAPSSCVLPGVRPSLAAASMNLAEVPKCVIFSAAA
jgi:hypothetical protein